MPGPRLKVGRADGRTASISARRTLVAGTSTTPLVALNPTPSPRPAVIKAAPDLLPDQFRVSRERIAPTSAAPGREVDDVVCVDCHVVDLARQGLVHAVPSHHPPSARDPGSPPFTPHAWANGRRRGAQRVTRWDARRSARRIERR